MNNNNILNRATTCTLTYPKYYRSTWRARMYIHIHSSTPPNYHGGGDGDGDGGGGEGGEGGDVGGGRREGL